MRKTSKNPFSNLSSWNHFLTKMVVMMMNIKDDEQFNFDLYVYKEDHDLHYILESDVKQ